ncbi:hypothetical protein JCGZ_10742 [Jatropha curcas]|uniref:Uncharacterized protein n=1 Tax=Jatropha curcas TaxID=180498 RepID=A0A067LQ12_JATCU|nr:hypothetical protein JCGZ_10742 [Jatropha curcas]
MLHLPASPTPEDQQCGELIKASGLRSVNLKQVIVEDYQAINANNINHACIKKLKGGYTKLEVKKVELEEALKSLDSTMKEQETRHKTEIEALNVEHEKLWEDSKVQAEKIKVLEAKNQELENKLKGFQGQEGSMEEDFSQSLP